MVGTQPSTNPARLEISAELDAETSRELSLSRGLLNGTVGYDHLAKRTTTYIIISGCVAVICVALSIVSLVVASSAGSGDCVAPSSRDPYGGTNHSWVPISRLAFGSCSAYDLRDQPVWDAVISTKPDAWLWVGDMSYNDKPFGDCDKMPDMPQCHCNPDFMRHGPGLCFAGNVAHARDRSQRQLSVLQYQRFLKYMCPSGVAAGSGTEGINPPIGTDALYCPRPIFGVYDDHDYGWNDGNKRLPEKHSMKSIFLDAIGEPPYSPRRSTSHGLQWHYTLNAGSRGHEVDLILLDERWYRDVLPCERRRQWCAGVLESGDPGTYPYSFCYDYLVNDSMTGFGSCCSKDERLAAWCSMPGSQSHPLWYSACDPTSAEFGMKPLALDMSNTVMSERLEMMYDEQNEYWPWLYEDTPFCDVLGMDQRRWLQSLLFSSTTPLKIIASGSVLAGSVGWVDPQKGTCSGDDFECYKSSQSNTLHLLGNTTTGCVLVLTGDFHHGDIKVIMPGTSQAYADSLRTQRLAKPIYQFMSSGLTNSTAHNQGQECKGTYMEDLVALRPLGSCSYVSKPNFGIVDIDWERRIVSMSLRDVDAGDVMLGFDGSRQQFSFSLDTCMPV